MAMCLEYRPEEVGHGENNADKRNIGQCGPLFSLPELSASIAAARVALRFAGVIEDLLVRRGDVDFGTQSRCTTFADLAEVHPHGVPHGGFISLIAGHFENRTQSMLRFSGRGESHGSFPWLVRAPRHKHRPCPRPQGRGFYPLQVHRHTENSLATEGRVIQTDPLLLRQRTCLFYRSRRIDAQ